MKKEILNLRASFRKWRRTASNNLQQWLKVTTFRLSRRELPVLVYQMGKVGSSTVYYSLKAAGVKCEHVHRILPQNIEKIANDRIARGLAVKDERLGLAIWDRLRNAKTRTKIITMVREPISRNISAFFQNLTDFYKGSSVESIPVADAIERFLVEYSHDVPLRWFDDEFEKVTGIRVFDHPFPVVRECTIIEDERFSVLVLRVEAPDEVKVRVIREFLGLSDFSLEAANVGDGKSYAELYRVFRDQVVLPQDYIDRLLESPYATHFYSAEEREKVRRSWLARG